MDIVKLSPTVLNVMIRPFSDTDSILFTCHDPEIACAPAGPFETRVELPFPVTGSALVALLSVNSNDRELPSVVGESIVATGLLCACAAHK